jgi:hypothetical protein
MDENHKNEIVRGWLVSLLSPNTRQKSYQLNQFAQCLVLEMLGVPQ